MGTPIRRADHGPERSLRRRLSRGRPAAPHRPARGVRRSRGVHPVHDVERVRAGCRDRHDALRPACGRAQRRSRLGGAPRPRVRGLLRLRRLPVRRAFWSSAADGAPAARRLADVGGGPRRRGRDDRARLPSGAADPAPARRLPRDRHALLPRDLQQLHEQRRPLGLARPRRDPRRHRRHHRADRHASLARRRPRPRELLAGLPLGGARRLHGDRARARTREPLPHRPRLARAPGGSSRRGGDGDAGQVADAARGRRRRRSRRLRRRGQRRLLPAGLADELHLSAPDHGLRDGHPRRGREPRRGRVRRGRRQRAPRGAAVPGPRALGLLRGPAGGAAREGAAVALARGPARRARRLRARGERGGAGGMAARRARAGRRRRGFLHAARFRRDRAPSLAPAAEEHVRGGELPHRRLRLRDHRRARARAHAPARLAPLRAPRADGLARVLRLGEPPDRAVADDTPALSRRDPDRPDDDAAGRPLRADAGGGRLTAAAPLLELRGLGVSFGGLRVIDNLDLHVDEHEIVSLIGPNGAGKTTVFNLITGVFRPDDGDILLDGRSLLRLPPHEITNRGVARTFQTLRLFLNMTVKENVLAAQFGRTSATLLEQMLQLPRARREERAMHALAEEKLAFFGERLMGYRWDQPAYSLSYANRRRLEIARATATEPRILLLDEPAAGMNPVETHEITELIGKLRDDGRYTILVIEHDMHVVEGISDRVVALDHGVKIAEGTFDQVATDPRVVEAYLGTSETARK